MPCKPTSSAKRTKPKNIRRKPNRLTVCQRATAETKSSRKQNSAHRFPVDWSLHHWKTLLTISYPVRKAGADKTQVIRRNRLRPFRPRGPTLGT